MRASKKQNTEANLKKGQYFQFIVSKLSKNKPLSDESAQINFDNLNNVRSEKYKGSKKLKPITTLPKNQIPFDIPKNWIWLTIKDVTKLTDNLNIQKELRPNDLVNYVDISCIDNNNLKIKEVKTSQVDELSSRARRILKKDFFLYSLVRPYLNNMAIVEKEKELMIGSTGFAVFESFYLQNEFLKSWLLSPFIKDYFLEMISGFNSPSISMNQFLDTPIPVAPIEEQKAIVSFFNSLESNNNEEFNTLPNDLIDGIVKLDKLEEFSSVLFENIENRKLLIPQLKQSILQEAIQGRLTADWRASRKLSGPDTEAAIELLKRIKAEKEQLVKDKKIKKEKTLPPIGEEEIPFELPDGWVWCRLGDLCSKTGAGSTPKGGRAAYPNYGIKFLRSQNIYDEGIRYDGIVFISKTTHEKMKGTKVQAEDLLLNITGGSIGRCCIVPKDFDTANINQHVTIIRSVILETGYYLHKIIGSPYFQNMILEVQTGAGREGLAKNKMDNILIAFPPLEEQKAIVEKVESLIQKCQVLGQEIERSEANAQMLMQAVLKEAFLPAEASAQAGEGEVEVVEV
ncbi:restriction endonuclease subunit S [Aequorivita antarctica]|uniref:Type I restriction modification DNA specificity domain-containing protein n=1 Tax=Aequorivita antarctica TaxID=153266 RepID=A0A5C6Z0K3_9FLAO|nr:restriction endonuclease subunit S [Aequorivita antarctica]TXD73534.1 hypothetical protein ESU54_07160 [Aequorivita antarctica]SRX76319.1 Type-1 restriction enzyme EcoKI specificity protein [Aequorivita antarctica]